MDLTDVQWAVLEPTFRPRRRPDGRGRPWTDPRAVMNGVLWVLRTGAPWHDLPSRYPPYQLAIVASNSGSARAASIGCCNASPRTSGTAARSI
jgi:transposase